MSTFNRAEIIDNNFITLLKNDNLPKINKNINLSQSNTTSHEIISIFEFFSNFSSSSNDFVFPSKMFTYFSIYLFNRNLY